MFTTIVAWILFVLTSLVPVFLFLDAILNHDYNERVRRLYALRGYRYHTSGKKVAVIFLVWFVSGWHLFG